MRGQVFLGKYEVEQPLGEGSMGRVFLARQRDVDRPVVVKVMHDHIAKQPTFREAFRREMDLLARLQHPNVVALYESSSDDPAGPCIVMEYVNGTNLEELIKEYGRLTAGQVGWLLGQLCGALQAAHVLGIIHRDLKPSNLMVVNAGTPDQALKVMDFGLATLSTAMYISLDKLKGGSEIIASGTPEYMPPEQVRGDEVDQRSDIYSVGVMLFEMLTGKLPFDKATIPELFDAHLSETPPTFAEVGAGDLVRPGIEPVVQQCLAKYPVERPRDAVDLAQRYGTALGRKILEQTEATASVVLRAGNMPSLPPPLDPEAVIQELEAYMPERIALVKLRGFVNDVRGELIESVPGLIRVRFTSHECPYRVPSGGPLAWLGLGRRLRPIELDLRMEKMAPGQSAQLRITLVMRPIGGGKMPDDPTWQSYCQRIYRDLRAYLMAK